MWRYVAHNAPGTSHVELQLPCQDAFRVTLRDKAEGELLVVACADGAGSAEFADVASDLACDEFVRIAAEDMVLQAESSCFDPQRLVDWLEEIHERLSERSAGLGVPVRQLATTILGAVIGEWFAYFVQIGDGAIVIRCGEFFGPVFWPQSGEYSNTTNFLTDDDYLNNIQVIKVDNRVDEVAIFTDGLERLALKFDTQLVHWPFFEPMLARMRQVEDASQFTEPLGTFLRSPQVNSLTDDDKTLVLATRLHDEATCR